MNEKTSPDTPPVFNTSDEQDIYIQGLADSYSITLDAIEEQQKSLNGVMSIYLENPLGKNEKTLQELETVYYGLSSLKSKIEDDYFQYLDKLKRD